MNLNFIQDANDVVMFDGKNGMNGLYQFTIAEDGTCKGQTPIGAFESASVRDAKVYCRWAFEKNQPKNGVNKGV